MDAIKTYLDNVFAAFPDTERVRALKRDMLVGLEEKYNELKWEGKSEHEAVGSVIAGFGSIDEIVAELGIENNNTTTHDEPQKAADIEDVLYLSNEEVNTYMSKMKMGSRLIGGGVLLILIGVSVMLLADTGIGVLLLMCAIAPAIAMFIVSGVSLEKFESYTKAKILLDSDTSAKLERQNSAFNTHFAIKLAVGTAIILLAVGGFVALEEYFFREAPVGMILIPVGIAVYLFVTAAMRKEAFNIVLGKGDYTDKSRNSEFAKIGRIIGTVAAVYWPIVVVAFLLWSFLGNAWHISWIIWPAAGILFGAFAGGISVWHGTKEKS